MTLDDPLSQTVQIKSSLLSVDLPDVTSPGHISLLDHILHLNPCPLHLMLDLAL